MPLTAFTYSLCAYLDPDAPFLMDGLGTQTQMRLADYQWLRTEGPPPAATPNSRWQSAQDDPQMRSGVDYICFFVIDMNKNPAKSLEFIPQWKSRTAAGRWTDPSPPPYDEPPVVPPRKPVIDPPGLRGRGSFESWFFEPKRLKNEIYQVTYSLTGAALSMENGEFYYLDPQMDIGPP